MSLHRWAGLLHQVSGSFIDLVNVTYNTTVSTVELGLDSTVAVEWKQVFGSDISVLQMRAMGKVESAREESGGSRLLQHLWRLD